ncbi:hypothetical protein CFP56_012677 [Quercus suber]|uniref:Uncharacterized protein n=1 Tax=Quercus suber TaxID=58331 RepID=A0AAW0KVV4_QUESU
MSAQGAATCEICSGSRRTDSNGLYTLVHIATHPILAHSWTSLKPHHIGGIRRACLRISYKVWTWDTRFLCFATA